MVESTEHGLQVFADVDLDNTYEVYHRVTPTFMDNGDDVLAAFPEGFVHVADVKTDHVGRVFELTNSIDRGWWENPEVTMTPDVSRARSTSVGDVIVKALAFGVLEDGRPVWKRWSIQMVGLREF